MNAAALDWYRGRRVFVTGHTGFKGAWLCAWLAELGAEVSGYALAPDERGLFADAEVAARLAASTIADVRDADRLAAALGEARPEVVFHLAAQSLVRQSYRDPVETFAVNVVGTATLLQAVREVPGCRAAIVVTSDKCYENDERALPFAEDAPMGGSDPYSASKGCQELAAAAFARSFFAEGPCTVARARAGNVIGGGDWAADRIVPDLARAAETGVPARVRRPDAVRPWQHVLDPLHGYLMLAMRAAEDGRRFEGGWNFGPDDADTVPVRRLLELVGRHWPAAAAEIDAGAPGPHEAATLRLDCAKARAELGWAPALRLDAAVALTADWYRAVLADPAAAPAVTRAQLHRYTALIGAEQEAMS